MLVSKKEPYATNKSIKYFIGYNDNDVIRPLCIKLPHMIGYVKCFDSKIYRDKVNTNCQGKKVP